MRGQNLTLSAGQSSLGKEWPAAMKGILCLIELFLQNAANFSLIKI
jgi:hypothetical protein